MKNKFRKTVIFSIKSDLLLISKKKKKGQTEKREIELDFNNLIKIMFL